MTITDVSKGGLVLLSPYCLLASLGSPHRPKEYGILSLTLKNSKKAFFLIFALTYHFSGKSLAGSIGKAAKALRLRLETKATPNV